MNKQDLVSKVASQADSSKTKAADAVDAVIGAIKASLKKGDDVRLVGFGTFSEPNKTKEESLSQLPGCWTRRRRRRRVALLQMSELNSHLVLGCRHNGSQYLGMRLVGLVLKNGQDMK